jgi:hypothetical protein
MRRLIIAAALVVWASAGFAKPYHFIAYGDTGYTVPRDLSRVEMLVEAINREQPAFSIHVGDFKGYTSCDDASYRERRAMFDRHRHPLILTPGDNDWADCDVESAGAFDPFERLSALRRIFFAGDRSLGGTTMPIARQNLEIPENARWVHEGIVFATIHAIGPHNGLVMDQRRARDAIERGTAGRSWIKDAFRLARERKAPALVLAFQADAWSTAAPRYDDGPLHWLAQTIGEEAANYDGQVLIVHGDSHRLVVDTPYRRADISRGTTTGMNVTRLQVPGWPDHRAVRVDVDPARPGMFGFRLLMTQAEADGARP